MHTGYSVVQGPRTSMVRPHPAVWRLVHGVLVAYVLLLVFLLFQSVDDARRFMRVSGAAAGSFSSTVVTLCTARQGFDSQSVSLVHMRMRAGRSPALLEANRDKLQTATLPPPAPVAVAGAGGVVPHLRVGLPPAAAGRPRQLGGAEGDCHRRVCARPHARLVGQGAWFRFPSHCLPGCCMRPTWRLVAATASYNVCDQSAIAIL